MAYDVIRNLFFQADRVALIEENAGRFKFLFSNDLGDNVGLQIPFNILQAALRDGTSLLIQDALKDRQFNSNEIVKEKGVRAALCVPFEMPEGRRGLVYVDSLSQAAAFKVKEKREVESLAERLAKNLQTIQLSKPESVDLPVPDQPHAAIPYTFLRNAMLAMVTLLVLLMIGAVVNYSSVDQPRPEVVEDEAPPDITTRPFGITGEFLSLLTDDRIAESERYLHSRLNARVTSDQLRELSAELDSASTAGSQLRVLSEVIHGPKAIVVVGRTLQDAPEKQWKLHFEKELDDWKLTSAEGRPFSKTYWGDDG